MIPVSIHAPRAGRDLKPFVMDGDSRCFNPRAPCGARLETACHRMYNEAFQSTRPVRGATRRAALAGAVRCSFNPRAPCGARPHPTAATYTSTGFNPRAPCGARQWGLYTVVNKKGFNPRAPCGARRRGTWAISEEDKFQSTRPVRGATRPEYDSVQSEFVSIHAPRAGRDMIICSLWGRLGWFQSTRPVRGATRHSTRESGGFLRFNPRAPCGARQGSDSPRSPK